MSIVINEPRPWAVDQALTANNGDAYVATGPNTCLLYTSPSPRDLSTSRMPSSA